MKKTILFAVLTAILIATPVLAAVFQANLTVVESSGNTYTNIGVTSPMNVSWMATNGYMAATGRDTRVVLGSNTYPHMLREGYINFAVPVNADSTVTYEMTTDNSLADMKIVPGYGGYVSIADDPALELGNNFEVEFTDAYINTSGGAGKYLLYKQDSFSVDAITASTIKASLYGGASTETLAPNGVGNETNIPTLVGAATNWQANLTDDGDTSYVGSIPAPAVRDTYATVNTAIGLGVITNVRVTFVGKHWNLGAGGAGCQFRTAVRTNGTTYDGMFSATTGAYASYFTDYALNPQTGAAWTWAEIDAMEIGVTLDSNGTDEVRCTQVYATVSYSSNFFVDVTPVTSGEYDISVSSDATWLMLSLDGDTSWDGIHSDRTATGGTSAVNNANIWLLMANFTTDFMPYLGVYQHTVGGTLIAHYAPADIIAGTVLPDRQGVAQNGIFTFGSNPAGVLIDVGALTLVDIESPEGSSLVSPDYGDDVNPSPDMTAADNELTMPNNEFYSFVSALATAGRIDVNMLWWWLAACLSIVAVAVGRKFTNNVWVAGLLGAAFSGFFVSMGGVELWIPAYIFIATAFVGVWQRTSDI